MWGDVDRRVRLGRILGLGFVAAGFVVIAKAWDGAASINFTQGQIPYLLSGGFLGLALVVTGGVLLLLATVRAERQLMTERFDQVVTLLGRNLSRLQFSSNGSGGEQVVAGTTAYHWPDCKILQGKEGLMTISPEQAEAEGLTACRVCNPPRPAPKPAQADRALATTASERPSP